MIWQTKKIDEVAKICLGLTHTPKYVEDGIPFLSVKDISQGHINFNNTRFITQKEFISMPDGAKPKKGDVLFCRVGTIGYPQIIKEDKKFGIFVSLGFFRVKKEVVFNKYIAYWMMSPSFDDQVEENVKSSTLKNLNTGWLKNFDILLPPIKDQKIIVNILDEIFEKVKRAKENAEKNLQNSKELFESYLQGVFVKDEKNWRKKTLGEVCDTGAGGTPLKAHRDYYDNGNIPWLRSGEVYQKEITKSELFITEKGLKNSSARIFPKNTVLVAMYGATAGQTGILRFESTTNQAVCGILPNNNFLPEFIYYFFTAHKRDLVRQAVGGAQPNISQIKIKNTCIPILSLAEQKSIVKKLDALSFEAKKLEAIYRQKLADLEELKKSVLKKAFSGGL